MITIVFVITFKCGSAYNNERSLIFLKALIFFSFCKLS